MLPIFLYIISFISLESTDSKLTWVTPQSHDFGEILRGVEKTYTFEFKNISNTPIVIDNVRTDCGCTASEWEETPVPAGQVGKIKISYDALKSGYFKKKITVWIRNQRKPEKLWIEGEVK